MKVPRQWKHARLADQVDRMSFIPPAELFRHNLAEHKQLIRKGDKNMATPEELKQARDDAAEAGKELMAKAMDGVWNTEDIQAIFALFTTLRTAITICDPGFKDEMGINIGAETASRIGWHFKPPYPSMPTP